MLPLPLYLPSPGRTLLVVASAMAVLSPVRAGAQSPDYRVRLDSLFDILASAQRTMGSVTIRRGERILYARTIGYRDSAATGWVRSDSATMFRIGSVTKPFTAAMIYQLVDQRRLTLSAKLSQFFPRLPNADVITVRDLLGHTSGLPDYTSGLGVLAPVSRDSLLRRIETGAVQFAPGTKRRYCNSNYLLLGYIVEAVTKGTYAAQLNRSIVRRIGLTRTRVGAAVQSGANEARAYYFSDGHWELQRDDAIENAGGAGSIVSTAADLTRFLAALFSGRLISRSALAELTTGFNDGTYLYGKGLGPFQIPGVAKSGYSHDGSIGAFTSLVGYVPDDSLSVALTINGHNYPQNRLFFHIWDILYGTAEPLPTFAPTDLPSSLAPAFISVYVAEAYGLTLTLRKAGAALEAQTTGQDPFPLTYVGANRFVNDRDGILIECAAPVDGVSPRCTLYQQKFAIPLVRAEGR